MTTTNKKKYAVRFFKGDKIVAVGRGEAKNEYDAYERADIRLYCICGGLIEYDSYTVEEVNNNDN